VAPSLQPAPVQSQRAEAAPVFDSAMVAAVPIASVQRLAAMPRSSVPRLSSSVRHLRTPRQAGNDCHAFALWLADHRRPPRGIGVICAGVFAPDALRTLQPYFVSRKKRRSSVRQRVAILISRKKAGDDLISACNGLGFWPRSHHLNHRSLPVAYECHHCSRR
jgi:hypothetical protein